MAREIGAKVIMVVQTLRLQPDNILFEIVKDMGIHPCTDKRTL